MQWTLITHGAVALAAIALTWGFQDARQTAAIAELQVEHTTAAFNEVQRVRGVERTNHRKLQGALNAARKREGQMRRDLRTAGDADERLRGQLADSATRIAGAPSGAVAQYAHTLEAVFADCRRRYRAMAEAADGHATDALAHHDAWPVSADGRDPDMARDPAASHRTTPEGSP